MCVHVYARMCVTFKWIMYVCVHMCVHRSLHIHGEDRRRHQISCFFTCFLFPWRQASHWIKSYTGDQQAKGSPISAARTMSFQITHSQSSPMFCMGVVAKLRPSCLCSKCSYSLSCLHSLSFTSLCMSLFFGGTSLAYYMTLRLFWSRSCCLWFPSARITRLLQALHYWGMNSRLYMRGRHHTYWSLYTAPKWNVFLTKTLGG